MTCCFTPQEKRIMDKNNVANVAAVKFRDVPKVGSKEYKIVIKIIAATMLLGFREGRERVYKILDRFQGKKPVVDIERAVYFTESMKQTEGKILVLRWAVLRNTKS